MDNNKTIKVEITFSDGSRICVVGDEAEKWAEAAKGQAAFCHNHGFPFPPLNWIKIPPDDSTEI